MLNLWISGLVLSLRQEFLKAMQHEENFFASFYNNQIVFESLGKELCISLDVALPGSGCEAVVEGFYSVVATHKKNGGRGNTFNRKSGS